MSWFSDLLFHSLFPKSYLIKAVFCLVSVSMAVVSEAGYNDYWTNPIGLSKFSSIICDHHIVADGNNNIIVGWQYNGTVHAEHVCNYSASQKMLAELTKEKENALDMQLAISSSGSAIFIWDSNTGIKVSHFEGNLKSWSSDPTVLSEVGFSPYVAVNEQGNGIAVWTVVDDNKFKIAASFYDAIEQTWSSAAIISPSGQQSDVSKVVIDKKGNATVVWIALARHPEHHKVQAIHYDAKLKEWSSLIPLSLLEEDIDLDTLHLAGSSSGNVIAVWLDAQGEGSTRASYFDADSQQWSIARTVAPVSMFPQAVLDEKGNGLVIWYNAEAIGSVFFSQEKMEFSNPIPIAHGKVEEASVAINRKGEALVVWKCSGKDFEYSRFDQTQFKWSAPIRLASGKNCFEAKVCLDDAGKAFVIWIHEEKNRDKIQMIESFDATTIQQLHEQNATTEIQAPLSQSCILPPVNVRGQRRLYQRRKRTSLVNIISWEKSPTLSVVQYHIYSDPMLRNRIYTVSSHRSLIFYHRGRHQNQKDVYYLTAANSVGAQSNPIQIVIT